LLTPEAQIGIKIHKQKFQCTDPFFQQNNWWWWCSLALQQSSQDDASRS
jgi:hypothetical protein